MLLLGTHHQAEAAGPHTLIQYVPQEITPHRIKHYTCPALNVSCQGHSVPRPAPRRPASEDRTRKRRDRCVASGAGQ